MTAPAVADEIDVGREPGRRWPSWTTWSRRRRVRAIGIAVVVIALGAAGWLLAGPTAAPQRAAPVPVDGAPGADVVVPVTPDPARCPPVARCADGQTVTADLEQAFRAAFPSAGYIGRSSVADLDSGRVYWQFVHFTTGTLVSVTLTQEPVELLDGPPPPDVLTPSARAVAGGSVALSTVRGGYLMTARVAGLPGQTLPVDASRRWLQIVEAP